MEMNEIKRLYEANGLNHYRLNTTHDLFKIHGIDYKDVEGYSNLDDINKSIYKKFIINIFNRLGLEARMNLIPKRINFVEDMEYVAKDPDPINDDCVVMVRHVIRAIDRDGNKEILYNREAYEKEHINLPIIDTYIRKYLRFEYEHGGRKEWLHVIKDGEEWY
ncbi:hypothetical protein EXQ37_03865 [Clostridium botulinum]|nr:hypothetical protein [Clostridium botulinum]MBO0558982.1 hypothetical protein [Clostridium botulinum]